MFVLAGGVFDVKREPSRRLVLGDDLLARHHFASELYLGAIGLANAKLGVICRFNLERVRCPLTVLGQV